MLLDSYAVAGTNEHHWVGSGGLRSIMGTVSVVGSNSYVELLRRSAVSELRLLPLPLHPQASGHLVLLDLGPGSGLRCSGCGSRDVHRTNRTGLIASLLKVIGLVPFFCRRCHRTFFRRQPGRQ